MVGVMDFRAMAVVPAAITVEWLAPADVTKFDHRGAAVRGCQLGPEKISLGPRPFRYCVRTSLIRRSSRPLTSRAT